MFCVAVVDLHAPLLCMLNTHKSDYLKGSTTTLKYRWENTKQLIES